RVAGCQLSVVSVGWMSESPNHLVVIPGPFAASSQTEPGTILIFIGCNKSEWIPAFAGMTSVKRLGKCGRMEQRSCLRGIPIHLRLQCIQVGKGLLVAQLGDEFHIQPLAIKIAVELE